MSASKEQTVVVGIDGSAQSIRACRWALRNGPNLGGHVHILGAWFVPKTILITPTYVEADYGREAEKAFLEAVEQCLEGLDTSQVEFSTQLIENHPRHALLEASDGAAALVIGTHGHGNRYPGMHLGSTASYLVHHATCPVIVIPEPPEAQS
jgi:nucleotide-binding universal stress UspA family protein